MIPFVTVGLVVTFVALMNLIGKVEVSSTKWIPTLPWAWDF